MATDAGEIVDRIEAALARSGMTARQLSEAAGIDETALSKIRSGNRKLKTSELSRIAEALALSVLALLNGDSLLSTLPIAGRDAGTSGAGTAYRRIQALAELDEVLTDGGIVRRAPSIEGAEIPEAGWLQHVSKLAASTRAALDLPADGEPFSSLVDAIESKLGIDVLVEDHGSDNLIGAAITDARMPFIFVNGRETQQRALFTLAHELGHILAKHTGESVWDRSGTFSGRTPEERVANGFAAELLMPKERILGVIDEHGRTARSLAEMILQLGVSFESLVYRLHNIGVINADGRDEFLRVRWTGLVAAVDDEIRSRLLALHSSRPERRSPGWLTLRAMEGFQRGVISVRPLAGLLQVEEDVLLDAWAVQEQAHEAFESDYSLAPGETVDPEELLKGDAA